MAPRDRTASKSPEVTPFPPLPRPPKAPRLAADPRQSSSAHTIGAIAGIAGIAESEMHVSGPDLSTGFHASGVDVERLQTAFEHGLARFDETQLETRWDEIFDWIRRVARTWVQRCKQMRIERRQAGIRIELETQDDLESFAARRSPTSASPPSSRASTRCGFSIHLA